MWYQCNTVVKISIHALLAESDQDLIAKELALAAISIHALLAESDLMGCWQDTPHYLFLSTLSLRRATCNRLHPSPAGSHFYPRSPCGERRFPVSAHCLDGWISIHALLAESDFAITDLTLLPFDISIHALLAESDPGPNSMTPDRYYFYPRSPCGERPLESWPDSEMRKISIHALLAESDPTPQPLRQQPRHFYPRSPCGERRMEHSSTCTRRKFLSTLSLRRATLRACPASSRRPYFYPRSPCGERRNIG